VGRKGVALMFVVVMIILSILLIVGTWLYLRRQENDNTPLVPTLNFKKKKNFTTKDLFEVQDVQRGIVIMPDSQYCAICRLSSPDFYLLGEDGQTNVEDAAAGVLMQLTYPVVTLVTGESLDTRPAIQEIKENLEKLPPLLQELAKSRADYLEVTMQSKSLSAKQAYLIVPYITNKGFDFAFGELQDRVAGLTGAFAGARVTLEILPTNAIFDLLSHLLNRNRLFRPSEAMEYEIINPYHSSLRKGISN
jgi:hypothetical protein